ncbi:MAG: hypothetical protein HY721_31975 [Planctomycetes bacterium]|nr:hypothetical protein [Planctomycetota bacterium]
MSRITASAARPGGPGWARVPTVATKSGGDATLQGPEGRKSTTSSRDGSKRIGSANAWIGPARVVARTRSWTCAVPSSTIAVSISSSSSPRAGTVNA